MEIIQAFHVILQDRRIAHMPYHALTHSERETFNARRALLAHLGDTMRMKAVEREKQRLMMESREGRQSKCYKVDVIVFIAKC